MAENIDTSAKDGPSGVTPGRLTASLQYRLQRVSRDLMKARITAFLLFSAFVVGGAPRGFSQTPGDAPPAQPEGRQRGMRQDNGGPRPIIGQITAIQGGTMQIAKPDGTTVSVKFTDKTDFRKDRQP